MQNRQCSNPKCSEVKPEFSPGNALCKVCNAARASGYYWENREECQARTNTYRKANPERMNKLYRESAWKKAGICNADGSLFKWADYLAWLIVQKNSCAICHSQHPGTQSWNVDHNHRTGIIRGLLCNTCNMGIGLLQDNADLLESAAEYLRGN